MPPAVKQQNAALIISQAIMNGLRESAPIVKNHALASLNRALGRRTGKLASSIYTKLGRKRSGGRLTVGTPVHYGRFWEFGFIRGGKKYSWQRRRRVRTASDLARLIKAGGKFYKRPWLRPAVDEAMPEVVRRVETHLNRAMSQFTGTVSIDIKIT